MKCQKRLFLELFAVTWVAAAAAAASICYNTWEGGVRREHLRVVEKGVDTVLALLLICKTERNENKPV